MPKKPFDFMIVRLGKDYGSTNLKKGEVCVVTPHNWFGNTNGWTEDDPDVQMLEEEEKLLYKSMSAYDFKELKTYWNQERGYVLYSKYGDVGATVSRDNNCWDVLNIDGRDQSNNTEVPQKAFDILTQYKSAMNDEADRCVGAIDLIAALHPDAEQTCSVLSKKKRKRNDA